MGSEAELAKYVISTRYENIPKAAVEATKRNIIDTLGCALAGSGAAGCKEVVDTLTSLEQGGSSTILVYNKNLSPQSAALANSAIAHALDYDDTHDVAVLHVGVVTVPVAFAVAEHLGGMDGKQMLISCLLGDDVMCRMGLATKLWIGWILTSLYGYFGASTTAGKLLGLNEEQLENAWGIAYAQAAGNYECIRSGSLTKRIQPAFACHGGILSSFFASRGITGAKQSMEGESGIFNLYQHGEYEPEILTANLGEKFEVTNLSYKPYPSCRFTHSATNAALDLAEKYEIIPQKIEAIKIEVSEESYWCCTPPEIKRKPRTIVDAQFSTPYGVAVALTKGRVGLQEFTESAIRDEEVLLCCSKIQSTINHEFSEKSGRGMAPARVTVKTKSGEEYSASVTMAKGHPQKPMTDAEIRNKFMSCGDCCGKSISRDSLEEVYDMIANLEAVKDVRRILRLLVGE